MQTRTTLVKKLASDAGFDFCGISRAEFLEAHANPLEKWLNAGKHGKMSYMEHYFDKRLDPTLLVPGAKTVVTLLYNHYPQQELKKNHNYHIAKYAYGQDYHFVIKDKIRILFEGIRASVGDIHGRAFVDSAPVMERAWAQRSGAGWIGKNSLLLTKEGGSFFFIAELIIDLVLVPDGPIADYCGTCTKCIDSCPTNAITAYQVDGDKCISYFTIELKDEIPVSQKGKFENWIFGCDICQDVCPWNRFSKPHSETRFLASNDLYNMNQEKWENLSEEKFMSLFKGSAVKRTKFKGLTRNIEFLREGK